MLKATDGNVNPWRKAALFDLEYWLGNAEAEYTNELLDSVCPNSTMDAYAEEIDAIDVEIQEALES